MKWAWAAFLAAPMLWHLYDGAFASYWAVFRQITWVIAVQNLAVMLVAVTAGVLIQALPAPFLWSWLSLFNTNAVNVNLAPVTLPYVGWLFCALFMVSLPGLVYMEEQWFREGTRDWASGLRRSLLFGFAHCLVGIPLAAGFILTGTGLWYTHQYFRGGTALSTVHHTTYNIWVLGLLMVLLVVLR